MLKLLSSVLSVLLGLLRFVLTPIRMPWARYARWLHTRWPAGTREKLPEVNPDGTTNVPGLYVVGDLTGVPLLKFSSDSGARAVQHIVADKRFTQQAGGEVLDLIIVGGGVSGMAAALEARKNGLNFVLLEGTEPFSTITNFPRAKPIFTYPTEMVPAGDLQFTAEVKEPLLEELHEQTLAQGIEPQVAMVEKVVRRGNCLEAVVRNADALLARRVIIAIGRSGNFRRLGVPGEKLDKVANRLHDPKDFAGKKVLVVGGGDSAMETAIAIAECGGHVDLSYRKSEFSRPKPENVAAIESLRADPMAPVPDTNPESDRVTTPAGAYLSDHRQPGSITLHLGTTVREISADAVTLGSTAKNKGEDHTLANDAVLTMIGREAPLDFFRRSRVKIRGETSGLEWIPITLFFLAMFFLYSWKNNGLIDGFDAIRDSAFPKSTASWIAGFGDWWAAQVQDKSTMIGTVAVSMGGRSFYYTLLYTLCIGWFGIRRILRRRTPYVTLQTSVLFFVQLIPLFLLPELILPWLGYNGYYDSGWGHTFAVEFFSPVHISPEEWTNREWPDGYHPASYWRAYGFILAFPLMIFNLITDQPYTGWLILSGVQTFVIIPLIVWKWGKGAYCGWICSCGGLAETMGDAHRHKMFHGPAANKVNMLGQVILLIAALLLALRVWTWQFPGGFIASHVDVMAWRDQWPFSYKWAIDILLGGILGVGLYFKYSGRIWCRFACPLAALMHIYARFSKFRIIPEKNKCISCNVCTSVCHMGIDIMNFANKGMPMEDPECVRCSACVQSCPTGVLQFGEVNRDGSVRRTDRLSASSVVRSEA